MELSETFLQTPLAEWTVRDFVSLMETYRNEDRPSSDHLFDEETWISGYKALAKYLNCSVPTICRLVKSGKIDAAIRRVGATYWFDKNMISNLLKAKFQTKDE